MENKKEQMEKAKVKLSEIIKEFDWEEDKVAVCAFVSFWACSFVSGCLSWDIPMLDFADRIATGSASVLFGLVGAGCGCAAIDGIKRRVIENKQNKDR